jgi:transcription initiation factor TFIIIB Brf1 subunit/transcription initiation factor TFIIB
MSDARSADSGPDELQIFDELSDGRLVCRVCGALIPDEGDYARIHWDWHEASNGA